MCLCSIKESDSSESRSCSLSAGSGPASARVHALGKAPIQGDHCMNLPVTYRIRSCVNASCVAATLEANATWYMEHGKAWSDQVSLARDTVATMNAKQVSGRIAGAMYHGNGGRVLVEPRPGWVSRECLNLNARLYSSSLPPPPKVLAFCFAGDRGWLTCLEATHHVACVPAFALFPNRPKPVRSPLWPRCVPYYFLGIILVLVV